MSTKDKSKNALKPKTPKPKKMSLNRTLERQWQLILMSIPFIAMVIIFNYVPLSGWLMAFQRYRPNKGLFDQRWVGFENFKTLFVIDDFDRVIKNTLAMSTISLVLNTFGAIFLALSLNEVRQKHFKSVVQTISYLPHFLSWVVAANLISEFLSGEGIINEILMFFRLIKEPIIFLQDGNKFWWIIGFSNLWKSVGWNSIIYLSSIASIDHSLYEAAEIDGANRYRKILHVTLPGMSTTIIILLIMSIGNLMNAGFEQQYLLQKGPTQLWAETIDIYTLKWGLGQGNYSLATAAGIFKSVVNIFLLLLVNQIAKRVSDEHTLI